MHHVTYCDYHSIATPYHQGTQMTMYCYLYFICCGMYSNTIVHLLRYLFNERPPPLQDHICTNTSAIFPHAIVPLVRDHLPYVITFGLP